MTDCKVREQCATLPFFAFIHEGPNLARKHINIPDSVLAEMDELIGRAGMTRTKFVLGGIQMALDDARRRFGEPANDILPDRERDPPRPRDAVIHAAPAPSLSLVSNVTPIANEDLVPCIKRGDSWWFDMVALCDFMRISPPDLLADIDPDDDVLDYQRKPWIDHTSFPALQARCTSPARLAEFNEWVSTKN